MRHRAPRPDDGDVTEIITQLSMSSVEFVTVLAALALVAARWLPPAARPRVTVVAAVTLVLSAAVLGVTGIRWQLLPVLAGAAAALSFALPPLLRRLFRRRPGQRQARRAPWWLALPGTAACTALVITGPIAAWAFPVPVFPEPSGPYAVGTRVVQWTDPDRPETFTAEPDDRRTVVVQLWCPARNSSANTLAARYLGRTPQEARTVSDALARGAGLPAFLLGGAAQARTHAHADAPVADGDERFPVVLFSPGSGGSRSQNTAWAEELATHGYVVAALDHPYDSAAVVLDDGRVIRTATTSTGDRDADERLAADWTAVRAADLRFVLTRLDDLDRGTTPDPLTGRLDTHRTAATGHSMGGAAALQAARQDPRIGAVIDLDGFPHGPTTPDLRQPVLALTSAARNPDPRYLPRLTEALAHDTATTYRLAVPRTAHLTFTDAPLYLPPLPSITGTLTRADAPRLVTAATLAFLNSTLRHTPDDLTRTLSTYGSLTVHHPNTAP
ncbi:alpha/beta hydrolase family protein [Kitasatospora sp. NPDC092948]|uniref:alpha/beta hydrolase family protein n=1 Tax=Kitasatospora sp. NPDC092948 TaxID=3364088 RepID=UPI0037FA1AA0